MVLTCVLLVCRPLLGYRLVTDAHYGGVVSVSGNRLFQGVLDFVNRRADLVVVTNEGHAHRIRHAGGTPFICPDPLPQLPPVARKPEPMARVDKSVLFICSFDRDEPYVEAFEAAERLADRGFTMFVTGRYARAGIIPNAVPQVRLLGYVDRATYDAYLAHADVILDLTTWQDCLVCGAYEAMAARIPCVLSETRTLTTFFTHGAVFCSHDPAAIAAAVVSAYEMRDRLRSRIDEWVDHHARAMRARTAALRAAAALPPSP